MIWQFGIPRPAATRFFQRHERTVRFGRHINSPARSTLLSISHRRLSPEARAAVGITDGVLRVSVGLEDVRDLVDDLARALG